jgi:hypothetical protein
LEKLTKLLNFEASKDFSKYLIIVSKIKNLRVLLECFIIFENYFRWKGLKQWAVFLHMGGFL